MTFEQCEKLIKDAAIAYNDAVENAKNNKFIVETCLCGDGRLIYNYSIAKIGSLR